MTQNKTEEILKLKEKRRELYLAFAEGGVPKDQKEYARRTSRYQKEIDRVNLKLYELTKNTIYRF